MERTIYSHLMTDELLNYALTRQDSTPLEVELAQRCCVLADMLDEYEQEEEIKLDS